MFVFICIYLRANTYKHTNNYKYIYKYYLAMLLLIKTCRNFIFPDFLILNWGGQLMRTEKLIDYGLSAFIGTIYIDLAYINWYRVEIKIYSYKSFKF